MEDVDGLFNIRIGSSDEATVLPKQSRDHQSEGNFLQQKASWKPKIETSLIWKSVMLPVNNPSKPESQRVLHAIEELYFLRCYAEAENFTSKILEGRLHDDLRAILRDYLARCRKRLLKLVSYGSDSDMTLINSTASGK